MMTLTTARILVVTPSESAKDDIAVFLGRMPISEPTYVINKVVPPDDYDFIIFDAHHLPPLRDVKELANWPEKDQEYFHLLGKYLDRGSKNIVWFGEFNTLLNRERCQAANSKFTLFARIKEMTDYLNYFK